MGESDHINQDEKPADLHHHQNIPGDQRFMMMEADGQSFSTSSSTTVGSESSESSSSSSNSNSLELGDDASSSSCSSSTTNFGNHGSMFELSELMATLPIKRGLSKFYQGKSESFTSLTRVMSIEDLVKKEDPYYINNRRKMLKASKSYANGFEACKPYSVQKSMISKNNSKKVSSFSGGSFASNYTSRPPLVPCEQMKH